jgi:hypothetical protein
MHVESLRRALRTQPFRPFVLKLVNGAEYTVSHPDWLSIPPVERPREVLYYRVATGSTGDYDEHRIDVALIVEVVTPGQPGMTPGRTEENGPAPS